MDHWINIVKFFTYYLSCFTITTVSLAWFISMATSQSSSPSYRLFSELISHKDKTNISKILYSSLTDQLRHNRSIRKQLSTNKEENHPRDGGSVAVTSRLETEDGGNWSGTVGRVSVEVPREQWPLLCRLPRGSHICLCFSFVSLLGDNVWLLFLCWCHKGSRDLQPPGSPRQACYFQKLGNPATCLRFCFVIVPFFTSRTGEAGFPVGRRVWAQEVPRQSFAVSPWKEGRNEVRQRPECISFTKGQ